MQTFERCRSLVVAGLFLVLIAAASGTRAADTIFAEPPEPEELARILYGPKYRSAASEPAAGRFGMMINFHYDSTKIVPQSLPLLDSVGEMLLAGSADGKVLVVEGHADASGPARYNQDLSERRADAIKRYLVGTFAIPETRLVTVGAGETEPHDVTDPYADVNRRVVFRAARSIVVD